MKYTHATIIVTNAVANNLRQLAARLDRADMDGMFLTPLSATGSLPATRWISTGMVPKPLITLMADPVKMFNIAKQAWESEGEVFPFTQTQVTNALSNCIVNEVDSPFQVIQDLGLKLINSEN